LRRSDRYAILLEDEVDGKCCATSWIAPAAQWCFETIKFYELKLEIGSWWLSADNDSEFCNASCGVTSLHYITSHT